MSTYPDGTANPEWFKHLEVTLPLKPAKYQILPSEVLEIICHRRIAGLEQYLVRWAHPSTTIRSLARFYSWHDLSELVQCLHHVQSYVDNLKTLTPQNSALSPHLLEQQRQLKRKTPDDSSDADSFNATCDTPSSSRSFESRDEPNTYNCTLEYVGDVIIMRPLQSIKQDAMPTLSMVNIASRTPTTQAAYRISNAFDLRLKQAAANSAPLSIDNNLDSTRPSLAFNFITKSVIGAGVQPVSADVMIGCGHTRAKGQPQCRPDMGQAIGCEYARVCECMELASVDEKRLKPEERALFERGDYATLPKRFPYQASNPPVLQSFYLDSRAPIYECNPNCNCGPVCKTRCVQRGRQVPLEIFKTENRGWGLRCPENLRRGQFIDTYVGEIITNAEADRREALAGPGTGKASYFYSLDKFVDDDLLDEDCYVVDGEFMGNVTRFINHSCEPNCRQYTVSYNKWDRKVYELAFFAWQNIPANTELTFDYMDREGGQEEESLSKEEISEVQKCRCGAKKCRGRLWY